MLHAEGDLRIPGSMSALKPGKIKVLSFMVLCFCAGMNFEK
jgi:hypothetical protein